ncbi:hypothetical protein K470DRAFT_194574, partial [Piedraia hortae CBS 480.64]
AATDAPTPIIAGPANDAAVAPSVTQNAPSKTLEERGLGDMFSSVGHLLGSGIPSYVVSGVPNFFQNLPTGDAVKSALGLKNSDLDALPTQVLNIDPYANWTDQGWNVRFHGNVYKQPNTSKEELTKRADDLFIYGTSMKDLPEDQQDQARNVTASIFVVQQGNVKVAPINLEPAPSQGSSGQPGGGGATTPSGGSQQIVLPYNTTIEGDFDVFMPIKSNGLIAGNSTRSVQRLNTYVQGASIGNSTAYLVPTEGITVVSDIDDILRVTKIYQPKIGLLNSFARPYLKWKNMPSIYSNWSRSLDNIHFHYLTTTPEQVTRNYMQFIYSTYPGGSFDTRPLNFSDVSATLSIRQFLLIKVIQSFPKRKFVLVADTTNSDVMKAYPLMAKTFPNVQCIFLRNTSATDPDNHFPYDTSGFKDIPQSKYLFFRTPDDLMNLDLAKGECYNRSVPQNLTFGWQNLPLGLSSNGAVNGSAN